MKVQGNEDRGRQHEYTVDETSIKGCTQKGQALEKYWNTPYKRVPSILDPQTFKFATGQKVITRPSRPLPQLPKLPKLPKLHLIFEDTKLPHPCHQDRCLWNKHQSIKLLHTQSRASFDLEFAYFRNILLNVFTCYCISRVACVLCHKALPCFVSMRSCILV